MPQLNPEFYTSQLFWLVVTFSFLLLFLWKISLPRISSVLEKRESKINSDIEMAKQLQTEAQEIQNQIDQQLHEEREKSNILIKETSINLQIKANEELSKLDNELNKKIDESTAIIESKKKESLKLIHEQIEDITKLILSKISSISINDQEIKESIVNAQIRNIN